MLSAVFKIFERRILMKTIDKDVLAGYNAGIEKGRLHRGLGLVEFERTKEILRQMLPPAPAVIHTILPRSVTRFIFTISPKRI